MHIAENLAGKATGNISLHREWFFAGKGYEIFQYLKYRHNDLPWYLRAKY